MNINATPEKYGYKIGQNIAPYITKCIDENGECYISEGEHIVGRNDTDWNLGHVWSDSSIVWGWNRKSNVKLIGAGKDKTILKFIDNVHSMYLFNKETPIVHMLSTNYDVSCDNNLIEGITFDGNYDNNHSSSTICCIRIRGINNIIRNCKFINFGTGDTSRHECFQVFLVQFDDNDKGSQVIDCEFTSVGKKKNSPAGHCPENTFIAVGGINPVVKNNLFKDCIFDPINQQSPLHAITIANSDSAEISDNVFENFQGACIYIDSWKNKNAVIKNNKAINVWNFIAFTCQSWDNKNQISYQENILIRDNDVSLTIGDVYYQWDQLTIPSVFFAYNHDPSLDRQVYPGFKNVIAKNNKITLGYRQIKNYYEESNQLKCYWGPAVDSFKICMIDNQVISTVPIIVTERFWDKLKKFIVKIIRYLMFWK